MLKEFWEKRWDENQIGFHEGRPNAYLERFVHHLQVKEEPRVLVPLCGKAVDLAWLAERNFLVTGIEFVPQAVQEFFGERNVPAKQGQDGGLPCYQSERICIAVGDFFRWDPKRSSAIDVAYDRAALVALRPEDRERYAAHFVKALQPGGRILLITFAYDQEVMTGPPFSVDADEVQRLFGSTCEVQNLADEDIVEREPRFRQRGLTWLREQAWLLQVR